MPGGRLEMADSPGDLTPDSPGEDDDDAQPVFGGMSWSWDSDTDFEALIDAANGAAPWLRDTEAADDPQAADVDPEADEAAYQEALAAGRVSEMPLSVVAGRIAESLPTGPGLAGWLAQALAPVSRRRSGGWHPGPRPENWPRWRRSRPGPPGLAAGPRSTHRGDRIG